MKDKKYAYYWYWYFSSFIIVVCTTISYSIPVKSYIKDAMVLNKGNFLVATCGFIYILDPSLKQINRTSFSSPSDCYAYTNILAYFSEEEGGYVILILSSIKEQIQYIISPEG